MKTLKRMFLALILGASVNMTLTSDVSEALDLFGFASYWEVDDADNTWGVGGGLAIPLFTNYLKLDGRAYYFENTDLDDDDELELIPIDFGLQLHLLPNETFDPYLLGGASYIYADADRADVDSDFGAYVGAALQIRLAEHFYVFGEALFRRAELDTDIGRDDELSLDGLSVNTGIKISL